MKSIYSNKDDAYLALVADDEKGLEYFFNQHYARLAYYCTSIVNDASVAEEIVSDSFIKLWNKRKQIKEAEMVFAFLSRVSHNAAVDYLRVYKRKKTKPLSIIYASAEQSKLESIVEAETYHQLYQLTQKLPPQAAKIFRMHYWQEKDCWEIAEEMGLSVHTVRNQRARAIQLLKKYGSLLSMFIVTAIVVFC